MNQYEKNVDNIKNKFQFLIALVLFFPVLVNSLFVKFNFGVDLDDFNLYLYSSFVALLIAEYASVEMWVLLMPKRIKDSLNTINVLLIIEIFLVGLIIGIIPWFKYKFFYSIILIPSPQYLLVAIKILDIIPIIIFILILLDGLKMLWPQIERFHKWVLK